MDAEDYAAHRAARRQEAAEIAAAEFARAELAKADVLMPAPPLQSFLPEAPAATPESTPVIASEPTAPAVAEQAAPANAEEAPKPRAKAKRKAKTVEEQRAAAMKAAAKRVASFREQHMGRSNDIAEPARWDDPLTPLQIARACDELIARGEKPSMRRVAEILSVAQIRVEKGWPKGVPLDGTGEYKAA
jgi:hypothetical protein